ncbi:hypothetical protein Tco_0140947 [Tanacetum coccineum]
MDKGVDDLVKNHKRQHDGDDDDDDEDPSAGPNQGPPSHPHALALITTSKFNLPLDVNLYFTIRITNTPSLIACEYYMRSEKVAFADSDVVWHRPETHGIGLTYTHSWPMFIEKSGIAVLARTLDRGGRHLGRHCVERLRAAIESGGLNQKNDSLTHPYVPEIFMQQFWYTIKKVQGRDSYGFLLANKKCRVDAEVFRKILDICPRVEGKEFTAVQNDDDTLTFLINLGYKGKSISSTEATEEEAARQVHATHARFVTESVPGSAKRRASGINIRETSQGSMKVSFKVSQNLQGVQSLTLEEQEVADILQALKESKKTSRRQPCTRGSSEGIGRQPGVPDESIVVSANSSEGTESEYSEEEQSEEEEIDWINSEEDDKKKDNTDNDRSIDLEMTDDEETDDEVLQGKEQTNDDEDEDEEMTNAEVEDSGKGFGDQFLKISFDTSLIGSVKDTTDAEIILLLDIKIQSEVPHIQSPSILRVPVSTTESPTITTTVPESDALIAVQLRVSKLEKDVSELMKIDHSTEALPTLKSQVPTVVDNYLGSKLDDSLYKTPSIELEPKSEKSASEILKIKKEQAEKQKMLTYTIKSTDKASLKEFNHKSAYHALMEALIEDENTMDKGVADIVKDHKIKHDDNDNDDDEDPPAGPKQGKETKRGRTKESESSKKPYTTKETPKGKAPSKRSKTGKSASVKEPVEEPIVEVVMDDSGEDVVHNDDQPQDILEPKTNKTPNPEWFKKPLRPPTSDPEWNKRQIVLDQPKQPWFNQMVSATKDPLTFNDLWLSISFASPYYQKKLNITAPQKTFPEIEFKELYTSSYKPPGVIYEDLNKQKRVMRADELYKFSDETLKTVHDELHHRILNFRLGYNKEMFRRKWTAIDKR